jgi:hypothetical protein
MKLLHPLTPTAENNQFLKVGYAGGLLYFNRKNKMRLAPPSERPHASRSCEKPGFSSRKYRDYRDPLNIFKAIMVAVYFNFL